MLVTETTQTRKTGLLDSPRVWVFLLTAGILLALGAAVQGQGLAELGATTAIQNDLATQPVAGGSGYVNRARGAAGMAGAPYPGMAPGGGMMPPSTMGRMGGATMPGGYPGMPGGYRGMPGGGMPGGAYPGMMPGGGYGMGGAAPAPGEPGYVPPFQYTPPVTYRAVEGRRVYDAVSYRLNPSNAKILDDPQRKEILEDKKDKYSDKGNSDKGDQIADDGLYSSILPPSMDEYTGGISHFYALKSINVLRSAQALDVIDFFGLNAVTNERFSSLEKERDKIADRDDRVYLVDDGGGFQDCWGKRFLDIFRIEPGNPKSDFLPLYIPRPPAPPAVAPPTGWLPPQAVKTPDEMALDSALKKFKAAMGNTMPADQLEERITALRQKLLADPTARQEFFTQYPPDVMPGTAGGPGMMGGMPGMMGGPGMYGAPGGVGAGGMSGSSYNPNMIRTMTGGGR